MTRASALALLVAAPVALAQTPPLPVAPPASPPVTVGPDRSGSPTGAALAPRPAGPRPAPDSALAVLQADPAFQYDRPVAEQPSLADRFWRWLAEHVLGPILQGSTTRAGQGAWLVLAVLVLVAVALRLFRAGLGGVFGRRDRAASDAADPLLGVEDIAAVDLDALLADAVAQTDWRAAVRLRYLVALQQMDGRGLIRWGRDKTNRALVREAAARGGADVGRAFADVTRAFESVWYGGLAVDAGRWARVDARFRRLDDAVAAVPARPRDAAREAAPA
ncbi:MAG TPA: DUF4129 domain-containing protein [Rubricoccaceae bacterium]